MTRNLLLLFLLCPAFCAAQSIMTVPGESAQASLSSADDNTSQASRSGAGDADSILPSPIAPKMRNDTVTGKSKRTVTTEADMGTDDNAVSAVPSRVLRPVYARSDFEKFVEDGAGHPVQVYGRKLFEEVPSTFAPMDRIPVPANYAIGPGDELLIRVWGKIDLDSRVIVDRNGQISLPKIGTLNVAGLHYEQLDGYLRMAVGNLYRDFELNVTLGQLRSIQILVLGEARQPGSYTLSSLSTLVDALFASGGPSAIGSMRHIQLRRAGELVIDFDLYDLQQKGDKSHDVQLLPGDEIYIPPVGPQVAVLGNVSEPAIFELRGDTSIASELEGAGGLTNLAAIARVLLERIDGRKMRRVDEFALDAAGLQRMLKDGDVLRISPISPQFENAVMIRGNVAAPGRFPWHEGMRVSDLIPSRGFLLTSGHWDQQNHLGDERHTDMMTDIAETNAEINWDYAAIERLDEHDLSTRLIAFNLGTAIDNPSSPDNEFLKVGDVVTIFSRKNLPLPLEKHATFVQVGGEVNVPGVYRINPGETLRDLVDRAGGLTPHSYLYASQLTRASTRFVQKEQLKLSISRMQKELTSQYANVPHTPENGSATEAVNAKGSDQAARFDAQKELISHLSTAEPSGRVVLGMTPNAASLRDIPDFPLEDGDSFYIPPRLGTVQVVGEVYNENAFRYQTNKPLNDYLNDSGGATRIADVKRIFLIRADGTVVSRQSHSQHWGGSFEKIVLMPGDAIIVPPKLKMPNSFMEELPMITQIVSQTAMTGAVISLIQ